MPRKQIFGYTECRQPSPGEYVRYTAFFIEGGKVVISVRNEKGEYNEISIPFDAAMEASAALELRTSL